MAAGAHPHEQITVQCLTEIDRPAIQRLLADDGFFWLDLHDPSEHQLRELGELFDFHPLTLEDAHHHDQRPKLDEYGDYAFLVFYGARTDHVPGRPLLSEVHMFISGAYVITLHQQPLDALEQLRHRTVGRTLRSEQFLVYQVMDAVTDTFFPVLATIDEEIDEIEDAIIASPGERQLQRIFALKRDLVAMRRIVTPQRDIFARGIERIAELPGLERDERDYFRDVYDHLIRISDLVDSYRDLLSGATDLHLSTIANRQGEVSKQLTIIATIFLPLTFLTGFFGQNFSFLVNHIIRSTWSFVALGLGSLIISCVIFLVFFRRRGWL